MCRRLMLFHFRFMGPQETLPVEMDQMRGSISHPYFRLPAYGWQILCHRLPIRKCGNKDQGCRARTE